MAAYVSVISGGSKTRRISNGKQQRNNGGNNARVAKPACASA